MTFQGEPTGLDPAIAWEVESWSIERLTYQTFLTYASKSGEAGTQLVPDLATEVPTAANGGISADGKVYTFHLKHGVKFAPPISTEVTAADFKWSFQRMLRQPLAPATLACPPPTVATIPSAWFSAPPPTVLPLPATRCGAEAPPPPAMVAA